MARNDERPPTESALWRPHPPEAVTVVLVDAGRGRTGHELSRHQDVDRVVEIVREDRVRDHPEDQRGTIADRAEPLQRAEAPGHKRNARQIALIHGHSLAQTGLHCKPTDRQA